MNMPTETFLTTVYTIVGDWYQQHAPKWLAGKAGKKPPFADSEVITLSLAQHWLGIPDERDAALALLDSHQNRSHRNRSVLGDNGFLDQHRQAFLWEEQNVLLVTPKRKNSSSGRRLTVMRP